MKDAKGPTTVLELQARFPDEAACEAFLRKLRWPKGFVCPRCQGRRSSTITTRRLEQCRACRYQVSLTAGTVLHRTRLPLRVWFWAIFFVGRHKTGISALQLRKDLGLGSYETAWTLLHKLRSTLGERTGKRLVGLVEADETYVGARGEPGVRGRALRGKSLVAAVVENRGGSTPPPCAWSTCPRPPRRSSDPSCGESSIRPRPRSARTAGVATATSRPTAQGTGR